MEVIQNKTNSDWQSRCGITQSKLEFLLENEVLSDVKFIVGDAEESIFAHKLILKMGSSVMENMLVGINDENSLRTEIIVPDVNPIIFRAILKLLYVDKLDIDWDDKDCVMDLLKAACKYGLHNLIAHCKAVIIGSITEKSAIRMYQLAISRNHKELSEYAFDFICRKAKQVLSGTFRKNLRILSKENLKRLAQSDALNIDEVDLFRFAVKWAKDACKIARMDASGENLREMLKDIIPHIRFFLMSAEDITLFIANKDILTHVELVQIYKQCTAPNHLRSPMPSPSAMFNATPRNRFWIAERFTSTETRTCYQNKSRGWLCKPKWQYISFKVDQPIVVVGIGLYGGLSVSGGTYIATSKPFNYTYEARIYDDSFQMLQLTSNTLENPGKIVHVKFDKPVSITVGGWYTIAAKIKSNATTFVGEGGHSQVEFACPKINVCFNFENTGVLSKANKEGQVEDLKENETSVHRGEIPEIAFYIENP